MAKRPQLPMIAKSGVTIGSGVFDIGDSFSDGFEKY